MSTTRRRLLGAIATFALVSAGVVHAQDQEQAEEAKRVLIYGDSNTWGYIPVESGPTERYPADIRWPGVMQAELGDDFEIIEEGLSARTTDVADPSLPHISGAGLDGSEALSPIIASHLPLDLVVIMLGTNDVKVQFDRSPFRIGLGMGALVDIVQQTGSGVGTDYHTPEILVLAPPPLGDLFPEGRAERFAGGVEKTQALPQYYEAIAAAAGAEFLDVGTLAETDGIDGVHFSAEAHGNIGRGVAEKVKSILD
ncbi:lysophospholipase L1-like esterase [Palleronia aestuarii]|uniref:Lysophospholipase L1-like esterase n=1 Tax=Palleronia aestuarii TaxID=568105 RepID=A0A2W7MYP2_9RHOB|nr:SGNH/GDSL hydrolase family protein [Palleronia aestuarii]PZX12781.1 lysophospholipase L1-like esterase [Palleronia aestuarii]